MKSLLTIGEHFFNCCNIPIKIIDDKLNEVCKYGYNQVSNDIYPKTLIETFIYTNSENLSSQTINKRIITFDKSYNYIIKESWSFYFIVGPISNKCNNKNLEVTFKPIYCYEYIEKLLENIIDNSLLFSLNCNSYNIYVKKAIEYVHNNYNQHISIDEVSDFLCINKSYFCNLFKKSTGVTFSYFLNYFRIEKSKKLLENSNLSLLDVALEVGFTNQNYFTMVFKKIKGKTPSQYKKILLNKSHVNV